jgi:hypothetical protein
LIIGILIVTTFVPYAATLTHDTVRTYTYYNGEEYQKVLVDFDNDLQNDTLLFLQNNAELNEYKLLIYLTVLKKYFEIDLGGGISPVSIKISKNIIEYGYVEHSTSNYCRFIKLRYHAGIKRIQVIGFDTEYTSSPGEITRSSYNLLTGKIVVKRTECGPNGEVIKEFSGNNGFYKSKVFTDNLSNKMVSDLDTVGNTLKIRKFNF